MVILDKLVGGVPIAAVRSGGGGGVDAVGEMNLESVFCSRRFFRDLHTKNDADV